jgi:hypothetical protein
MEMWARWAHRVLWHDLPAGWALHKSHHEPRTGLFEDNDVFAIVNALPAIGACAYGFFTPGVGGALSFGLGLGITLYGARAGCVSLSVYLSVGAHSRRACRLRPSVCLSVCLLVRVGTALRLSVCLCPAAVDSGVIAQVGIAARHAETQRRQ